MDWNNTFQKFVNFLIRHEFYIGVVTYLLVSSLFSVSIFIRLLFFPSEAVMIINEFLYFINYPLLSGVLIFLTVTLSFRLYKIKKWKKQNLIILIILPFISIILNLLSLLLGLLPEYATLISPLAIVILLYLYMFRLKEYPFRKKIRFILPVLVIFCFVLPLLTTNYCFSNILSQASDKTSSQDVVFISDFVRGTNFRDPLLSLYSRADNDFQKYLLTGVGKCKEMAIAASMALEDMGYRARIVSFPGEDHAFVEVDIDGTWMVVDPGYYQSQIVTREDRADYRLREMGAISYAVSFVDSSFIELTQDYVPTDTIIIRIRQNGEALSNAQIYLEHTFRGRSIKIPSEFHTFFSNSNGTVTLHMGALNYNENAGEVDSFFRIYVNGNKTDFTVTSSGSNQNIFVPIDL